MRLPSATQTLALSMLACLVQLGGAMPAQAQTAPAANPAVTLPAAGPFRLGMTLDQVRAAAPQIEWRDLMVSPFTRRVFAIRSDDTLAIAGVEFEIEAMAHYYEHRLRLDGATQAADALACERVGLDVLAALEPQAGPFTSNPPVTTPATGGGLYWQTQRSANGSITVAPVPAPGTPGRVDGETLQVGSASTVLVEAFDEQYRPRPRVKRFGSAPSFLRMQAHRDGNGFYVEAEVNYGKDSGSVCAVSVAMNGSTQPPLPQTFDTSKAKLTREISIAERHFAHARLAGLSGPALEVELACEVNRQSGWLLGCGVVRPDSLGIEQEAVALNLSRLVEYDMSGVDRDDPQGMRGTLRVTVDPAAVRPTDFLAATRTPLAEVEFAEQPDPEMARAVPALLGLPDEPAEPLALTCRIEADGSLLCIDPSASTDPDRARLVAQAARIAASSYRAAPALRSGGDSTGRVIDLTL